jgi:hypothetical protein
MFATTPDFTTLRVALVDKATAREMIVANHYSHKWSSLFGVVNIGIFRGETMLGVAVYGYPMNPSSWGAVTDLAPEKCLELNRLWIDDELGTNTETWLLAQSFDVLRRLGYRLIQSFSDGRLGVGTIYQAANFTFHGFHTSVFHEDTTTGNVHHGTAFNNTANAKRMISSNLLFARKQTRSFKTRTYRYLFALDRGAKRNLKGKPLPYPKERLGAPTIDGYIPPTSQVARAIALASAMGMDNDAAELTTYLRTISDNADDDIATQSTNRWVTKLRDTNTPTNDEGANTLW